MQRLRYSINLTLDGVCDHDSIMPDQEMHTYFAKAIEANDIILFGRVTYEMMESAWREPGETGKKADWMEEWMVPFAQTLNKAKKYVVSDSMKKADWNCEIIRRADLEKTVRKLKQQPGRGIYTGGVTMPQQLVELGLIDDFELVIHPKIRGFGRRLFDGLKNPVDLKWISQYAFKNGAQVIKYSLANSSK